MDKQDESAAEWLELLASTQVIPAIREKLLWAAETIRKANSQIDALIDVLNKSDVDWGN